MADIEIIGNVVTNATGTGITTPAVQVTSTFTPGATVLGDVATGAMGPKGADGAPGAAGAQGPQGPQGPAGPSGGVSSVNGKTGTVTLNQDDVLDGTTYKQYSQTEKTKLAGIASGATANSTDAQLRDRSTHTGTQLASTISNFNAAASAAAPVQSVAGKTGTVSLVKGDVGLGNVDNTSDANKPVSTAQQTALDGKENAFSKGNLIAGSNVTLSGTLTNRLVGTGDVTINATGGGGGGTGDVTGGTSSVNNEVALYSGTTGKVIKSAGANGMTVEPTTGNTTIAGNLTLPSQVQFSSSVYTQFQSLAADLNFKSLLSTKKIVFTVDTNDVMSLSLNKALITQPVQITAGTPGAGKVLTSDASGNATWQTPSGGGGGNTINYYQPSFAQEFTYSGSNAFTLSQAQTSILAVSINGQVLQASEYAVSTNTVTVTPASHTFVNGDIVRILALGAQVYSSTGGFTAATVTKTSSYSITLTDYTVRMDATSGNVTATLPSASAQTGQVFHVLKADSSTNTVTVAAASGQLIGSAASITITNQYTALHLQSNGTGWDRL